MPLKPHSTKKEFPMSTNYMPCRKSLPVEARAVRCRRVARTYYEEAFLFFLLVETSTHTRARSDIGDISPATEGVSAMTKCRNCGHGLDCLQACSSDEIWVCVNDECQHGDHLEVLYEPTALIEAWHSGGKTDKINIRFANCVSEHQRTEMWNRLFAVFYNVRVDTAKETG
jgi:hypothetical protein